MRYPTETLGECELRVTLKAILAVLSAAEAEKDGGPIQTFAVCVAAKITREMFLTLEARKIEALRRQEEIKAREVEAFNRETERLRALRAQEELIEHQRKRRKA